MRHLIVILALFGNVVIESVMRSIKVALDPLGILNPGRVI